MARKPKAPIVVCDETNNSPEAVKAGVVRVDVTVPRGTATEARDVPTSRALLTIPPESRFWELEPDAAYAEVQKRSPVVGKGDIVRLQPPASATDEQVERLKRFCAEKGAERVFVLPRPRAEVVPERKKPAREGKVGARAAVASLIAESNSKDREALSALAEEIMGEVGL